MKQGDHVVCIDGKFTDAVNRMYLQLPVEGQSYVIRAVFPGSEADSAIMDKRDVPVVRLLLVGLVNPNNKWGEELGFNSIRFRTLEELVESQKSRLDNPEFVQKLNGMVLRTLVGSPDK